MITKRSGSRILGKIFAYLNFKILILIDFSDGGAVVPESCIFGILLNVSTFFCKLIQ